MSLNPQQESKSVAFRVLGEKKKENHAQQCGLRYLFIGIPLKIIKEHRHYRYILGKFPSPPAGNAAVVHQSQLVKAILCMETNLSERRGVFVWLCLQCYVFLEYN